MNTLAKAYQVLIDRHSFKVILVFVALMGFVGIGSIRALRSNSNDVTEWLPDSFEETAVLKWYHKLFGYGSDNIVIASWEGCTLDDPRLDLFAEKLRRHGEDPGLFRPETVITGRELLDRLTESAPLYLKPEYALERLNGALIGPDYLHGMLFADDRNGGAKLDKVDPASKAASEGLKSGDFIEKINGIETPTAGDAQRVLRDAYAQDSSGTISVLLRGNPNPRQWRWSGPPPQRQSCVLLGVTDYGREEKRLKGTLGEISRLAQDECGIAPADFRMGGPLVDNLAIDEEGKRTLAVVAGFSFIVGLLMCWLCFRSLLLTWVVFFTALVSEGTSLAILHYSGAKVNAILLSMPTLIYVLTISGAIHIVNYYRDAILEGGLSGAAVRAVRKGFWPCALAAVTTAVGLASLNISHILPIRMFGVYSAIGVIASLFWIFLYLPACLEWLRPISEADVQKAKSVVKGGRLGAIADAFVDGIQRRHAVVFGTCMVVLVVFGYGALAKMKTSVQLMELFSPKAQIVQDYAWLEQKLGSLVPMEVIIHTGERESFTVDGAEGGTYQLTYTDEAGEARQTSPISYRSTEHEIQAALRQTGLDDVVVTSDGEFPDVTFLINRPGAQIVPRMASNTQLEGADPKIEHSTVTQMNMYDRMKLVWNVQQAIEALEEVDTTLAATTFAPSLSGGPFQRQAINGNLKRHRNEYIEARYMADTPGEELYRISLRLGALDKVDYGVFVEKIKEQVEPVVAQYRAQGMTGLHVTYTGVVPLVYKAQAELLSDLFKSFVTAFVLIAGIMVLLLGKMTGIFRAIPAGACMMLPNVFPAALIFGAMAWSGILVDIGSMMTASVAMGVAVDDTIHFLTWFRRGMERGLDHRGATRFAYAHCARAMTETTIIAGFGMSVFALSTFTPTMRFGYLMVGLLLAALIGDLIMLPAMLSGPVGKLFRHQPRTPKSPDQVPTDSHSDRSEERVLVPTRTDRPVSTS